jgi:hypothetical protein
LEILTGLINSGSDLCRRKTRGFTPWFFDILLKKFAGCLLDFARDNRIANFFLNEFGFPDAKQWGRTKPSKNTFLVFLWRPL